MAKNKYLLILITLFFIQSCSVVKKSVPPSGVAVKQSVKSFINSYEDNSVELDFLQIQARVKTDLNNKQNSANLKLYIEKERIWANVSLLGITGARANITPQGVKAYEILDKTYIDGDFAFFNEKLKVDFIDFDKLKRILLGQMFLISSYKDYELNVSDQNQYILSYKNNNKLKNKAVAGKYIHSYYLDSNYRLEKIHIIDPKSKTEINVFYDDWLKIEDKNLPNSVKIFIKDKENNQIELKYNNFDFSEMNPPFRIPKNYKKRKL